MVTRKCIFRESVLNIFTDGSASVPKPGKKNNRACAGVKLVTGPADNISLVEMDSKIYFNMTINKCELKAVELAIDKAVKYKDQYDMVNIFSDSANVIFAFTKRIYNWIENSKDGILIGAKGDPIPHQNIILSIIYKILDNNLHVRFYHLNSHIDTSNEENLRQAKDTFIKSNHIPFDVSIEVIKSISKLNSDVDTLIDLMLHSNYKRTPRTYDEDTVELRTIDIVKYSELTM